MASVVKIGGKSYIEPGSYAFTKYNPTTSDIVSNFGNVLLIDTTGYGYNEVSDVEYSGGSGIKGELSSGIKSVYEFSNSQDFRKFVGGGKLADLASKIFNPLSGTNLEGTPGAPKLFYVRAAVTTAAKCFLPRSISPSSPLILISKNEGLCANTSPETGVIRNGYMVKITNLTSGINLKIYKGTFEGEDFYGEPFGAYSILNSLPELIFDSGETGLTTMGQVKEALSKDKVVKSLFEIVEGPEFDSSLSSVMSDGQRNFEGGNATYGATGGGIAEVFEAINELDINFVLGLTAGNSVYNQAILTYLKTESKFKGVLFIPASEEITKDGSDLSSSIETSEYFDSEQVVATYGTPMVSKKDNSGLKLLDPVYLTASILGLVAGGAAQTPVTFKRIGYQNFAYDLTKTQREKAIQSGLMHVRNINGYWCVNQGITTVQDNLNIVALDGQTRELSIVNIKSQIEKELILEGEKRFVGNAVSQSSPESIKNFTETKLASFVATPGNDNLILSWKNVKVTVSNGDSTVTYDFVPNVPLNKVFFIGNMLDFKF